MRIFLRGDVFVDPEHDDHKRYRILGISDVIKNQVLVDVFETERMSLYRHGILELQTGYCVNNCYLKKLNDWIEQQKLEYVGNIRNGSIKFTTQIEHMEFLEQFEYYLDYGVFKDSVRTGSVL